ncbi:hypothetical protein D3C72_1762230 [compost metagenome]
MKLATQALQPAFPPGDHPIGEGIGEIHMQPSQPLAGHLRGQPIEQPSGIRRVPRQQTGTRHRGKRHGCQQLRVIGDARPLTGVGPSPVEHVLAARMSLYVSRHSRQQPSIVIAQQAMGWQPAVTPCDAATVFQRGQEGMA